MGIEIGPTAQNLVALRDKNRIAQSELRASAMTKEAKTVAQEYRAAREAMFEAEKCSLYGPGRLM